MRVEATALFRYLALHAPEYRAKLLEVREEVARWLAYVPQTFPHYTQHTVEHSEAIIGKLSKLLFQDDDPVRPVLQLSGAEAYIVSAAAYLHDAGMVASDREKEEILRSDEWRSWTTGEGGGASRWRDIEAMRTSGSHDPLRNFAADRQVRFLIAEFIRRRHARRAADVIAQHHVALGRLDYGDVVLRTTIADICVAHGLDRAELEDRERFPERREIRNELVNVRFLAVLLRMGDLLDMRHDRACSLLLTAACPLPADSYAHWTQYQRITHELVAHDRIELRAECLDQEEHRFLHDWCSWLVDEVHSGAVLMARAPRHQGWRAPVISLGDGSAGETVVIRPAPGATYLPRRWQFELDAAAVFQRLISDLYQEREAFLRELIQNALDAMRCRMYLDLRAEGLECPEYPTDVPPERRARYQLRISLEAEIVRNPLSGAEEVRQVLVVDDCGIGMDQEVIEKYFLQVGRSYYTSDSFRRTFPFHPVSRFGVGFLSVFAVSDHVTIETLRSHAPPIRLTLTGPRSYLLVERAARVASGTRIAVRLREPLAPGRLAEAVRDWCRRVEFSITVQEQGTEETIVADRSEKWVRETPDPSDPAARVLVRAIPIAQRGVEGELYVISRVTAEGESWIHGHDVLGLHEKYPLASLPRSLESYVCQQGLLRQLKREFSFNFGYRVDDRRRLDRDVMDRAARWDEHGSAGDALAHAWWVAVTEHLETTGFAKGPDGWQYIHDLAEDLDASWWARVPGAIPVRMNGVMSRRSLEQVTGAERFTTVYGRAQGKTYGSMRFPVDPALRESQPDLDGPVLFSDDLDRFARRLRKELFEERRVVGIEWVTSEALALTWARSLDAWDTCDYEDSSIIGIVIHPRSYLDSGSSAVLNANNALVQWGIWAQSQQVPGASSFWERLRSGGELHKTQHLLQQYLDAPLDRSPPKVEITEACYLLMPRGPLHEA